MSQFYLQAMTKDPETGRPMPKVASKQNGSDGYFSLPLNVGTNVQSFGFGFTANSVMITNDGTDDIKVGLQGKSPVSTSFNQDNAAFTYNGTTTAGATGSTSGTPIDNTQTKLSGATDGTNYAIFKPNTSTKSIAMAILRGGSSGSLKFELSSDNGVTWKKPSDIPGVIRWDGAQGTVMDTFDTYVNGSTPAVDLTFYLPYDAKWAIKVTKIAPITNGGDIFIDGGRINLEGALTVRQGETQVFPISSADVKLVANSGAQPVRLVAIS